MGRPAGDDFTDIFKKDIEVVNYHWDEEPSYGELN